METTNKEKLIQLFNLCINDEKKHSSNLIQINSSGSNFYYNWDYGYGYPSNNRNNKILKSSTWFENVAQDNVSSDDRTKAVTQHSLTSIFEYAEPETELKSGNWVNITINFDDLPPLTLIAQSNSELTSEIPQTYRTKTSWFQRKNVEFIRKQNVHSYSFKLSQGTVSTDLTLNEAADLLNNYYQALQRIDLQKLEERIKGYNTKA